MKISAINPNFQGNRDNIDAMINVDDAAIKKIAYLKTISDTNYDKKHKIANTLVYSAPLAAGLSAALLTNKNQAKIFSRQVHGLAAKAAIGLKAGGIWGAGLAALGLMGAGLKSLRKNSQDFKEFDSKHPFVTTFASIAAGFGILELVARGALKLKDVKAPELVKEAAGNVDKFLNKNETVRSVQRFMSDSIAKLPKSLKKAGKFAALWSPETLLLSGLLYSMKTANKEHREFHKNYSNLKQNQSLLAQARVRELAVQNDYLMQDADNREEIELLKNPTAGLNLEEA